MSKASDGLGTTLMKGQNADQPWLPHCFVVYPTPTRGSALWIGRLLLEIASCGVEREWIPSHGPDDFFPKKEHFLWCLGIYLKRPSLMIRSWRCLSLLVPYPPLFQTDLPLPFLYPGYYNLYRSHAF
jgi:hypothetical protein